MTRDELAHRAQRNQKELKLKIQKNNDAMRIKNKKAQGFECVVDGFLHWIPVSGITSSRSRRTAKINKKFLDGVLSFDYDDCLVCVSNEHGRFGVLWRHLELYSFYNDCIIEDATPIIEGFKDWILKNKEGL